MTEWIKKVGGEETNPLQAAAHRFMHVAPTKAEAPAFCNLTHRGENPYGRIPPEMPRFSDLILAKIKSEFSHHAGSLRYFVSRADKPSGSDDEKIREYEMFLDIIAMNDAGVVLGEKDLVKLAEIDGFFTSENIYNKHRHDGPRIPGLVKIYLALKVIEDIAAGKTLRREHIPTLEGGREVLENFKISSQQLIQGTGSLTKALDGFFGQGTADEIIFPGALKDGMKLGKDNVAALLELNKSYDAIVDLAKQQLRSQGLE